jgi:hypothetical protein
MNRLFTMGAEPVSVLPRTPNYGPWRTRAIHFSQLRPVDVARGESMNDRIAKYTGLGDVGV